MNSYVVVLKVLIAIIFGTFALIIPNILMIYFSKNTNLFENSLFVKKGFMHLSMIIVSLMIILLINRGSLQNYGFNISLEFNIVKIVIISIVLGFLSSYIASLMKCSNSFNPTRDFTLIHKVIFVWILASIAEEVLARGLIQGYLTPLISLCLNIFGFKISLPVLVSALFFGSMHLMLVQMGVPLQRVLIIVVFGFILGIIAGYLRESTDSLFPAIVVHACFNIGASPFMYIKSLINSDG